jgi:CcmD family protein
MILRRTFDRISTMLVGLGTWLTLTAPAVAQDFVKVDDAGREQLPATPFVGVAYGFIWVAVLVYLFSIARRLGRLQGELADLRRRIDRAGGEAPARR